VELRRELVRDKNHRRAGLDGERERALAVNGRVDEGAATEQELHRNFHTRRGEIRPFRGEESGGCSHGYNVLCAEDGGIRDEPEGERDRHGDQQRRRLSYQCNAALYVALHLTVLVKELIVGAGILRLVARSTEAMHAMTHKHPVDVRKHMAPAAPPSAKIDRRVERTTRALGGALVALMLERQFDNITVQDILDRAGVGRSAFYSHFRNKDDVLLTDYERILVDMDRALDDSTESEPRLAPVAELFRHVRDARHLVDALRSSGHLAMMWDVGVAHLARTIEKRIGQFSPDATGTALPITLASRLFAGALIEMLKCWLDRDLGFTPAQMDRLFHDWARNALRGVGDRADG
jgi:AcrR family transcriptional regulator